MRRTLLMAALLVALVGCTPPVTDDQPVQQPVDPAPAAERVVRPGYYHPGHANYIPVLKTPLVIAAQDRDLGRVATILAASVPVNSVSKEAAIGYAMWQGDVELVEALLAGGVDLPALEYEDGAGEAQSYLYAAIEADHLELADFLVDHGADGGAPVVTFSRVVKSSPLVLAIKRGHTDLARKLLERGASADPAPPGPDGVANLVPLVHAVGQGNLEMVELLIAKGATADCDEAGIAPLHVAIFAETSQQAIVDLLLANGARTDIFTAAALGRVDEVAGYLADKPSLATATFRTEFWPLIACAAMGDSAEMITLLAEAGADIDSRVFNYGSPLGTAAAWGNLNAMQALLDHGAKLDDNPNAWPLLAAAGRGRLLAAELLLANGADVNRAIDGLHQDIDGWTALHSAALKGQAEMVEFLIARGADVNAVTDDGDTPLSVARQEGHADVVRLLQAHGAEDAPPSE